jgi:type IVB pilus formation R64 PilN family outer membrane protein
MLKRNISVMTLSVLMLSSCQAIKATKNNIATNKEYTLNNYQKTNASLSSDQISFSDKPYLGLKTFVISDMAQPLPHIFNQSIKMNSSSSKSIEDHVNSLANLTGLDILITNEGLTWIKENKGSPKISSNSQKDTTQTNLSFKVNINYKGNLKGYLNRITNRFGLFWSYNFDKKQVIIFHNQVKSFKLVVPQTQITNQSSINNTNSGNSSQISYKSSDSDAFEDAINTIKSFSKETKVQHNKAYSLITVNDSPRVIEKARAYIKEFNQEAKKAVQVKIAIYEVKTNKDSNYGIDWNLIYNGTHANIDWNTTGLGDALANSNITTASIKYGVAAGMWAGSNIVASAISKYLDATYVQGFNFYSLNGQTTPINNGQTDSYVKELAVTTLGASGVVSANNVQTSVTQATINTGFTGSVLSNITDEQIFLRLSLDMSKLINMEQVEYGDKNHLSSVQLPHTENNKIIQNVILKSGQTAVITGFSKDLNKEGQASLGAKKWWWFGGNESTQSQKSTLVVIVSAYLIGDTND